MWRRPDLMADTPCRTGAADQPRAERTGRSRVVKSDGTMGRYAGGEDAKRTLLTLEAAA